MRSRINEGLRVIWWSEDTKYRVYSTRDDVGPARPVSGHTPHTPRPVLRPLTLSTSRTNRFLMFNFVTLQRFPHMSDQGLAFPMGLGYEWTSILILRAPQFSNYRHPHISSGHAHKARPWQPACSGFRRVGETIGKHAYRYPTAHARCPCSPILGLIAAQPRAAPG